MTKLIKWVAAAACALPLAAMAVPTATAVWRSNLGQSYTIGGNTYALTPRNGTLNQDGTITVSSTWGHKAPYIDLEGANVGIVSVLVKYSGLDISQIYDADGDSIGVAFASIIDSDDNVVGSCVQKVNGVANNTVRAYHCGASATSATPRDIGSMTAVEGSGYLLFAFKDSQGSRSYMGTSIDNLTGGEDTEGHWTGRSLKKLVLGGDESGKAFNGAGFKIEEVAIFVGSYLTASDVADYVFPTVTADAAVTTMSGLNAKIASLDNEFLYFSNAAVVTLDEEPSEATKSFLQGANWNGTVFIKDQNIVNLNPTIYGNPNSTLKLSGVSGYFNLGQYGASVTPKLELEDSDTEGKEYGFKLTNGYSFSSGNPGSKTYHYVRTPELKGSGTYDTTGTTVRTLLLADKFDNFNGVLKLGNSTVWLGHDVPALNESETGAQIVKAGVVRLGSTIPANYATWTVPNGYEGTIPMATTANQTETSFLTNAVWKGTCQLNWNASGKLDIVNYGNANSVIEIPSTFSALPTQNGGDNSANIAAEVKVKGNWTVSDGWSNQTTTFAKLSGEGTLTVNGSTSGETAIPYTITRLEGFTGTIAGTRGKFTIGTIVAATEPTPGTKLVNFTTANAPVLDSTKLVYNNAEQDVNLEFKAGDGIYVAQPPDVTITVPVVANTTMTVSVGGETVAPATEGVSSNTYSVAQGATVTVTYTSDDYEVTGGTFVFVATEGYEVETTGVVTRQYVACIVSQQEQDQSFIVVTNYYTTVSNAFEAVESGQTIKVLCDNTSNVRSVRVKEGTTVTLDLNGCTVTGPSGDNSMFWLEDNSNFVVTDTTEDKAGKLVSEAAKVVWSSNRCTLTLTAGTLESTTSVPVYIYYNQDAAQGSRTVNINGGRLVSNSSSALDYCVMNASGTVNMRAGEIVSACGGFGGLTVNVSGGTVTVGTDNAIFRSGSASITVTGGTFNKTFAEAYLASGYEILNNGDGTYTVRKDNGWMYAAPGHWDYTGTWSEGAALGDDKVTISDGATYSNRTASAGQLVTLDMTMSFEDINDDDGDLGDAKAAIRLGEGETEGTYVFQLYTYENSDAVWKNATGFAPTTNTDYTIVFELDLSRKTYTAGVVDGATTNLLSVGGSTAIAFANQGTATPVQTIDFVGAGTITSIEGSYGPAPAAEEFEPGDTCGTVTLNAEQAAWLNAQNNHDALAEKIEEMGSTAFINAYLLNLDILASNSGYVFAVTDIDVGTGTVDVKVQLTRTGALTEGDVAKPIIGTLKLKGTAALGTAFTVLATEAVEFGENADFSDGATETTVTVDTDKTDAKFYQAVIE